MPSIGEKVREIISKKPKLAIFVDGPNVLRKDVNLSLKAIKERIKEVGAIKINRVFLNQNASDKLIEAAVNEGFEVVSTPSDIDVCMAVDATDVIHNPNIDVIVLVTRDTDFHFVLKKAKEHGKTTIVIAAKSNFSSALKNTADEVLIMESEVTKPTKAEKEAKPEKELKEEKEADKEAKEDSKPNKETDKEDKPSEEDREKEQKKRTEKEKDKKEAKGGLIEKLSKRIKGQKKEKTEQKNSFFSIASR